MSDNKPCGKQFEIGDRVAYMWGLLTHEDCADKDSVPQLAVYSCGVANEVTTKYKCGDIVFNPSAVLRELPRKGDDGNQTHRATNQ